MALLKRISFEPVEVPKILWFDFNSTKVGNVAKGGHLDIKKKENVDGCLVPIEKTTITEYGRNAIFMITRKQFPVTPAEAITIHKSQGATYNQVCVDLGNNKYVQTSMVYVAYSRVTSLNGLYIVDKLVIPSFKKSPALEEMEQMRARRRMKLSYEVVIKGDELTIVYQNINSLLNKLQLITCDKWYLQSNILIFSETYTKEKHDSLNIPGYTVKYRHDAVSKQSGRCSNLVQYRRRWTGKYQISYNDITF